MRVLLSGGSRSPRWSQRQGEMATELPSRRDERAPLPAERLRGAVSGAQPGMLRRWREAGPCPAQRRAPDFCVGLRRGGSQSAARRRSGVFCRSLRCSGGAQVDCNKLWGDANRCSSASVAHKIKQIPGLQQVPWPHTCLCRGPAGGARVPSPSWGQAQAGGKLPARRGGSFSTQK